MAAEGDNDTCLELALEGEKLCKAGKCRDGVAFFEAALQAGTDDFRTLSAIYSQLGMTSVTFNSRPLSTTPRIFITLLLINEQ